MSGFEMMCMYFVIPLAGIGLWRTRDNPMFWPLTTYLFLGLLLHSLVITNVGCLYRFRYIYWFLFIILAVRTLVNSSSFPGSSQIHAPAA